MERLNNINRERLAWLCQEQGVSVAQAFRDAGLSDATARAYEDEDKGLTYLQLKKLADFFGRGILFLLESGPVEADKVHSVNFRTLNQQKLQLSRQVKKLIERVERQRELYLALVEDLNPEDVPTFAPPDVDAGHPAEAAAIARRWLGLNGESSFDGYRTAVEAKGVLVFRTNGYAGDWQIAKDNPILGFSLFNMICPVIVVKKATWDTQQTFTLFHELGHLLLHRESSIDDEADIYSRGGHERDANAFAGHLLVPDTYLRQIQDGEQPERVEEYDVWLAPFRRRWGASTEVILRRLLEAGRLAPEQYAAYRAHARTVVPRDDLGNRAYRHREPKHIFGERFVRTVLHAMSSRRISKDRACAYLDGLKLADLRQLEQHVAAA